MAKLCIHQDEARLCTAYQGKTLECPFSERDIQYGFVKSEGVLRLYLSKSPFPDESCNRYSPIPGTAQDLIKKINRL